ncbi:MAG: hypothetical protein U0441_23945 [Polyangiaceae bacterium]
MLSSLRSTSGNRTAKAPRPLFACALLLGLAAVTAPFGCAQEGATPTCEDNVSSDGILINKTQTPCDNFGRCFGTFSSKRTLDDGTEIPTVEVCGDAQVSDGTCKNNSTDAMICCCAALSKVDTANKTFIQYAYENGACINKSTGKEATNSFTACLYGYGQIDLDTGTGGSGGTGGTGGTTP